MRRATLWAMGAVVALMLAYVRFVRPWTMRWGATDEELARPLPGDALVRRVDYQATRAITIDAEPERVWPWLVQIGSGRAGWYAYDWVDNARVPSADTILPELQALAVGDLVPMVSGKDVGVWVKELEQNRRMLLWDRKGEYSWEWVLDPIEDGSTRLITRLRATYPRWFTPKMLYTIVATTGDIVMVRKQLRGIKARAEGVSETVEVTS